MVQLTDIWRKKYEAEFASMQIKPEKLHSALATASTIAANQARYEAVSQRTNGVPWYFIGVLHELEASGDFTKYLGNGQLLSRVTTATPAGRGPFHSFEDGAVDALVLMGFQRVTDWGIGSILFHAEENNGEGYHERGLPSPYVWAGSNEYHAGKYDVDGHYNPNLISDQLGAAVLLQALIQLGKITLPSISPQPAKAQIAMATATTTTTPAPVTTTTPANSDAFQALLAAAKTDINAVYQKITGVFAGLASGGASIALAAMLPDKTMALIVGTVGGVAGLLTIIIHLYTLFTGLNANNSSTIVLFENGVNTAQRFVGMTPTVWDNGPSAVPAAS